MSIQHELQKLTPTAIVELFELALPDGTVVFRFYSGTNSQLKDVVWQGKTYSAIPVEADGFDTTTKGTLPRPRLKVANVGGVMSREVVDNDDLVGYTLTRKRTFVRFLDAVNFTSGNPQADPTQCLPDDVWFIDSKVTENRLIIEWELASAFDLQGVQLPGRQVIQNTCTWVYRGSECGYTGSACYDENDQTTTPDKDICSKRLASCRIRFQGVTVPFGGFPGAVRYGQ